MTFVTDYPSVDLLWVPFRVFRGLFMVHYSTHIFFFCTLVAQKTKCITVAVNDTNFFLIVAQTLKCSQFFLQSLTGVSDTTEHV